MCMYCSYFKRTLGWRRKDAVGTSLKHYYYFGRFIYGISPISNLLDGFGPKEDQNAESLYLEYNYNQTSNQLCIILKQTRLQDKKAL